MSAGGDSRTFEWTAATVRWWLTLGHNYGCRCPCKTLAGRRRVDAATSVAIWRCWSHAVARIVALEPRDANYATHAMYAFRDRATRPR